VIWIRRACHRADRPKYLNSRAQISISGRALGRKLRFFRRLL
jgi:hypothetical protein